MNHIDDPQPSQPTLLPESEQVGEHVTDVIPGHELSDHCWCGPAREEVQAKRAFQTEPAVVSRLRVHRERPVEGEGRPGPVDPHRWEALFQRERDVLAARLAVAEAERDEALARFDRYRLQFREITFDGLSLADWHAKHCAAQQVALAATAKVDRVMAMTYASDDGAEFEHDGHGDGFGEPECPGCWAEGIRAALADEEGR